MSTTSKFWENKASDATLRVADYLATFDEEVIEVSDRDIAYFTDVCRKTVQRARAWLVDNGLIELQTGNGIGNTQKIKLNLT